jgi:hypothetical protein
MRIPIRIVRRLRWLGFTLALISVFLLTTFKINYIQATGWGLSALSCSIWVVDSYRSKHKPRMCMEIMYLVCGIWGIINWTIFL